MEFRGLMGGFYRISEWIMRLSVTNILWVVCSLPFFYLLLVVFLNPEMVENPDLFKQGLFLIGVVSPFTLVPATAAVFTVARKWVTGDVDVPLLKTFFRGYKENYLQSMLGGIAYLILTGILYVNYQFYGNQEGTLSLLSYLFITLFVILVASFFNYLSIMVHFHMKFWQILKNSLLITIGRPIASIIIIISNVAIVMISFKYNFLIPFFMGSVIAIVTFWHFHRGFIKLQEQREKLEQMEAEREQEEQEEREREDTERPEEEPADSRDESSMDDSRSDRSEQTEPENNNKR
ncbi:YesL family protein [Paenibacillus sp. J2TS4]|uniref:YesL family protein n=1 Tax=Paenibacillus sp. J2TS4 TaxID=2807194 RepID=UPI001B0BFDDB|nr:DUF624 domain-containing protein [Paenibacillus sp. J2TS4]GIP33889.1 hypothetical protein J2TS4_30990 [Paenibacillus sp. J2TS4]